LHDDKEEHMASEHDRRDASAGRDVNVDVNDTPGVPQAQGKGAAPGEDRPEERHASLPEHRRMGVRRDLGEGDQEASDYADSMSHEPSRS
jgi:hypothetical protein